MNVVEIEVSKLMPYWHNPRKNDRTVEKLIKSIENYGFNVPLVVNKDMVLITGHARLKAAKKMGLQSVPCVVVDMTEEQAKKYRIADNKIQESTEWNEEALFKELREIGDPLDLIDMGFTSKDIADIVGDIDSLVEEVAGVEVAEIPQYEVGQARAVETEPMPEQISGERIEERPTPVPDLEAKRMSKEEMEEQIRRREAEMNGRFVKESYEQTRYDNIVVCPHCGKQFKVRGVK